MVSPRSMVNRNFYPGDLQKQVEEFLSGFQPIEEPPELVGGVVPHAGWPFSGRVAARVWANLAQRARPSTVILFAPVHRGPQAENAVYPEGEWETPLGPVEVDASLAAEILSELKPLAVADP